MVLSASFGSYPRPDVLREYQIETYGKQKKIDHVQTDEDKRMLTESMKEVVSDQTGLDIITDGMLTWDDYLASVAAGFDGIRMSGLIRFYDNNTYYRRPVIEADISNSKPSLKNNLELLKQLNPGAKTKAVVPGPYTLYMLSENKHYGEPIEAIAALREALEVEVKALDSDYVQIDEPSLSYDADKELFPSIKEELEKLTSAVSGKSIVSTFFGNLTTSMSDIADIEADYIGIDCISFANNFELLVQSGLKNVQLGLLDARNTKIEDETQLKNKIDILGSDDIILSTNCGLEFLPRQYALRKTDLLATLANE
jgi:5-methyltetrahydropteroyltriglutamate--homocysteine methyltransferase